MTDLTQRLLVMENKVVVVVVVVVDDDNDVDVDIVLFFNFFLITI